VSDNADSVVETSHVARSGSGLRVLKRTNIESSQEASVKRHRISHALLAAAVFTSCNDATFVEPHESTIPLPAYAIVPQATAGYLGETSKIDISGVAELAVLSSITDGTQTVTFGGFMVKHSVGTSWAVWGAPPYTESTTPHLLIPQLASPSIVMTLSQPSPIFGFEVMASLTQPFSFTAVFFAGNTVVETITQDIPGFEARLFAASAAQPITKAIVFINQSPSPTNFAIAQIRYGAAADFKVTLDPRAEVDRATGEAVITGTMSCARRVSAGFNVSLTQTQKSKGVTAIVAVTEGLAVSCNTAGTPFSWSVPLTPVSGEAFVNGAASASIESVTPLMTPVSVASDVKLDWAKK
jgi:hypothetical protein